LFTLEAAVRELTEVPARLYGLRERGRVAEGWFADLVVFDPSTVGTGPTSVRHDFPAGAERLYNEGVGIAHVFVNGEEAVAGGAFTDARTGELLRSGVSTETVGVPGHDETGSNDDE
jgi:N-acyl-D-aspartate/D-glutamate deacylase